MSAFSNCLLWGVCEQSFRSFLIRLSELLVIKEVGVACLGKGGDGLLDGLEGLVSGGGGGGGGEGEGSQKGNNLGRCFFC